MHSAWFPASRNHILAERACDHAIRRFVAQRRRGQPLLPTLAVHVVRLALARRGRSPVTAHQAARQQAAGLPHDAAAATSWHHAVALALIRP